MFKQLIGALRKRNVLGEMIAQFEEMLDLGHGMFAKACDVVAGREKAMPSARNCTAVTGESTSWSGRSVSGSWCT